MGTFAAAIITLTFFFPPPCSSVRIGLPEDHVNVSSCFNRACISEHDWQEIGDKWHNFRDRVRFMNDTILSSKRIAIWRIFQEGNIWNMDDRQAETHLKKLRNMRNRIDLITEKMEDVQIKDATTRYDHQAIIMIEGDITVQKAAHYLYNKHPSVSTLYEYSPETNTINVIAGEEHVLGKHSRVQIVGHGRDTSGEMRLSEKTPMELAELVHMLPIKLSELGRVSLVGCNIGYDGQSAFLNDGFSERFLKSLQFDQTIHTEVSSRNELVSVTASGKKETGKIEADGIQWFSKDPLSKTVMKLGYFNEVIRIETPLTEGIASYNQDSSGSLMKLKDISPDTHEPRIFLEERNKETDKLGVMKVLEASDINEYIKTITRTNFLNDIDFIKEKLIDTNIVTIREKIQDTVDKKITSSEDKVNIKNLEKKIIESAPRIIEYHEFAGRAYLSDSSNKHISDVFDFKINMNREGNLEMHMSSPKAKRDFFLESGIKPNFKYVARLNTALDRVIKVEKVREITSRADLIHEINMFGAFGIDMRNGGSIYRYYRFGDMVYKMKRGNFYIKWDGMIASDAEVKSKHLHDGVISEADFPNPNQIKQWKWVDNKNRYILPKGHDLETYPDMKREIKNEYANRKINEKIESLSNKGKYKLQRKSQYILEEEVGFALERHSGPKRPRYFREDLYSGNVLDLMGHFIEGQYADIKKNQMHILEGSTVLAVGLSEPIRNFRTFAINDMMMTINSKYPISLHRLIECNPMTRGSSWGYLGNTGLTVNERGHHYKQKSIVLPREINIARTFLLTQTAEDGQNSKYRFLTEKEYTQVRKTMPQAELDKITLRITEKEIHSTIADYKPETNEPIVRTKPLGDFQSPSVGELELFSDSSSRKALPIRASVSIVNDYIHILNHVSKVIAQKNQVTGKDFDIIQSSIEVDNGNVKLFVRDQSNPSEKLELNIEINDELLKTKEIKQEASKEIEKIQEMKSPSKSLTSVNHFLGVYGIVMGFRGAVKDFEEGKIAEGIVNIAQSVHGIYGMSQTAQKAVQKITSRILSYGLERIESSLSAVTTEMSTVLSRGASIASKTLSAAGRVAQDIPILGTAFGIYNAVQDLRRKSTIGYIDAGLDVAITISALFGPEALVVTVALTIVRLVIDDFYYAINKELKNLPVDATVLQKIGAVFKGIGEGIVMTIKHLYDFASLGLVSLIESCVNIDKKYNKEHALFRKMSDYHNYLQIVKEGETHEKVINFAGGEASWNGGDIIFKMYDNNTARLRMEIVDENGKEKYLDKVLHFYEDINDIFLGIGESHDISFKKESAKLFWIIPVHSRYLIDKIRGESDTLHGTYYGNSKDNKFFTVQNLTEDANLGYSLADYYYEIYGEDGDDTFYLGPQKTVVKGGNGRDTYIIPYSGESQKLITMP